MSIILCLSVILGAITLTQGIPASKRTGNNWGLAGDPHVIMPGTFCGYPDVSCPIDCQQADSRGCILCKCGQQSSAGSASNPFSSSNQGSGYSFTGQTFNLGNLGAQAHQVFSGSGSSGSFNPGGLGPGSVVIGNENGQSQTLNYMSQTNNGQTSSSHTNGQTNGQTSVGTLVNGQLSQQIGAQTNTGGQTAGTNTNAQTGTNTLTNTINHGKNNNGGENHGVQTNTGTAAGGQNTDTQTAVDTHSQTNEHTNAGTTQTSTDTNSQINNANVQTAGCPKFPEFCLLKCVSQRADGCLICNCPSDKKRYTEKEIIFREQRQSNDKETESMILTKSSGHKNLAGCPPLRKSCPSECLGVSSIGCVVCSCSSISTSASSSESGGDNALSTQTAGTSVIVQSHIAKNNNGCPAFPNNCDSACAVLDANGCPICKCQSGYSSTSGSGSNSSSQSNSGAHNANGCPVFPRFCKPECAALDSRGCPICNCQTSTLVSSSVSSGSNSGNVVVSASSKNNNGCPPFRTDCPAECAELNSIGCPVCACSGSVSGKGPTSTHMKNNNGCPTIPRSCPSKCVAIDSDGCVACTCAVSGGSGSTSSGSGGANNNNGCPSVQSNCPANCLAIDPNTGCVLCTCTNTATAAPSTGTGTTASMGGSGAGGCPAFDASKCDLNCITTDSSGCLNCECAATSKPSTDAPSGTAPHSTGGGGAGGCPAFDASKCDLNCITTDSSGCLSCNCAATSKPSTDAPSGTTSHPTSGGGGAGGCPAFDASKCDLNCITTDSSGCLSCNCAATSKPSTDAPSGTTPHSTGGGGAGGCPAFDASKCDLNCIITDVSGCLSCNCPATSEPSTDAPSGTTPRSTGGSGGSGAAGAGGCPSFDASKCDLNCIATDSSGCLSCNCAAATSKPLTDAPSGTTPSSTGGGGGGAGGCPAFDASRCELNCITTDSSGCLSCNCPATSLAPTDAPSGTTTSPNGGGAGGCPTFDASKCDLSCITTDSRGCLSCYCAATPQPSTKAPSGITKGTSGGGAGGCPAFDASTCDLSCITTDSSGCLSCDCAATSLPSTKAPSGITDSPSRGNSGGAGGCPAFDASKCDLNCITTDGSGCLSCSCAAITTPPTTQAPSGTSASSSGGGAGGCPAFDASKCDLNCIKSDKNGCLSCNCEGTTPSAVTPKIGSSGGCLPFDASKCDMNCITMADNGCLSCHCSVTIMPATTKPTIRPIVTTIGKTTQTTSVPTTATPKTTIKSTSAPTTTIRMTSISTTTRDPDVCPPVRCVYPCDAGIRLGPDRCPICQCRSATRKAH